MSQFDFGTIDPATKSGSALASDLNSWRDALLSCHKGPTRPSYIKTGQMWIDDSASTWGLKVYDGTSDIIMMTLDPASHAAVYALAFASQAEAEAGTATDKPLNALGVAQAIAVQSPRFGIGQTIHNVSASRSFGAVYQNTTGREIYVSINANSTGGGFNLGLGETSTLSSIKGTTISSGGSTNLDLSVPHDWYYGVTASSGITSWVWWEVS